MYDTVEIIVRAGDGGDGAISFRHEKFVPFGGPDGGDGGDGGDVVLRADVSVDSLRKFRQKRSYRAPGGKAGAGSKKHGAGGQDLVITVPLGTLVTQRHQDGNAEPLADLVKAGDEVVAARGGDGGWGNVHFASSTNQAPRIAQRGETGGEATLRLEMRLIADVGIIGYPNAGKSTLLAAASAARPRIDSYPFTTLEPVLGVVDSGGRTFVLAEIPGLVADAHLGRGLGHEFLRHTLRTRMLIHLVSGDSETPLEDMQRVNEELAQYDRDLMLKRQVVAVNKIDLPEVEARLPEIKRSFEAACVRVFFISAAGGRGVAELMSATAGELEKLAGPVVTEAAPAVKVFRPQPKDAAVSFHREGDVIVLSVPALERIKAGDKVGPNELRWQLKGQLARMGVSKALEKAGVKPGDKVRCGPWEWEW